MPSGDDYRAKAAEFLGMAEIETDGPTKIGYQSLSKSYLRLAEQADRNALADISYEPPMESAPIVVKSPQLPGPPVMPQDETPDSEIV